MYIGGIPLRIRKCQTVLKTQKTSRKNESGERAPEKVPFVIPHDKTMTGKTKVFCRLITPPLAGISLVTYISHPDDIGIVF